MKEYNNPKMSSKEAQMKFKSIAYLSMLLVVIAVLGTVSPVMAQGPGEKDSIWLHTSAADWEKTADSFILHMEWELFFKKAGRRGTYASDWTALDPKEVDYTYRVEVATDSAFGNIVKKEETMEMSASIHGLEYNRSYVARVVLVDPPENYKDDFGGGIIYKHEKAVGGAAAEKKNLIYWVKFYLKYGGWQTYFIIAFALFGLFIVWPTTWWRLRLANVFPPNKPGFLYAALPFDRTGKTDHLSDKGNVYIREVAKYWSRAMAAMVQDPSYWKSTDDFIKASMQEQEEVKKRMWVDEGLPAIEQAIDVCKNGVPGIKLKKKPLEYPFPRVLLAALENQRANRNNWWASQEMDRATENTSYKEIDDLKSWGVTTFWALGSIEPMLGLFGTVQGIQKAFMGIQAQLSENPDAQMSETVEKLAGGIQQALITTILGLLFGIPFMLMYYYYRGKADFIFSKWEEIVIEILNRA